MVRSSFRFLVRWCSRKLGWVNQVEWKGGKETSAVWSPAGASAAANAAAGKDGRGKEKSLEAELSDGEGGEGDDDGVLV